MTNEGPVVGARHWFDRCCVLPSPHSSSPNRGESGEEEVEEGPGAVEKTEAVFNGSVVYYLLNGEEVEVEVCSWIVMSPSVERKGELQADSWRVYTDSRPLVEAIGRMTVVG